jgi:hypothetical protein
MMVDILSWRLCLGDAAAKPTKCDFNLACRMAQRQGYIWLTLGSWLACLGRKVVALKSDGRAMYSPPAHRPAVRSYSPFRAYFAAALQDP